MAVQEINYTNTFGELKSRDILQNLRLSLQQGDKWKTALMKAVSQWTLPEECVDGVHYQYLLLGEAFDWMRLASRILNDMDEFVSIEEKEDFLFQSELLNDMEGIQFSLLIGSEKYRGYLNYFYGIVVEESLVLSVEEDMRKERLSFGFQDNEALEDEAYRHLYGKARKPLVRDFLKAMGRSRRAYLSLTEMKEFTYWLFKKRVNTEDSARVGSDTKKGLERLFNMGISFYP